MNILFSCVGRRNYLLEYFRQVLTGSDRIVAIDSNANAPGLSIADKAYTVPEISAPDYEDTLFDICRTESVDALISLSDMELPLLSKLKSKLAALGCSALVADPNVVELCFDKLSTWRYLESINLDSPACSLSINEALQLVDSGNWSFPLIVKPRWGSQSIGVAKAESESELRVLVAATTIEMKRSLLWMSVPPDKRSESCLIQPFIEGVEFGCDVINDLDGNYQTTLIKQKLAMRFGETDQAITVDHPGISRLCQRLSEQLRHPVILDCDVIASDSGLHVIELNPRFGGGYPFSHMAGANVPGAIVKWLRQETVDRSHFTIEYGQSYSKTICLSRV